MKGEDINEDNKKVHDDYTKALGKAEDTLVAVSFSNVC